MVTIDGVEFYSELEVANILGIERDTLYRKRKKGEIECCQISKNKVRYTAEQIRKYLEGNNGR